MGKSEISRTDPELGRLADRLHSLAIHLLRTVRQTDAATGLTPARLSALSVIVYAGPLRLGELAAAEGVTPPTMSRLAAALVEAGLAVRRPDPADQRSVQIEATDEGREVLGLARRLRLRSLVATLADLTPVELEVVGGAVEILAGRFGVPERAGDQGHDP